MDQNNIGAAPAYSILDRTTRTRERSKSVLSHGTRPSVTPSPRQNNPSRTSSPSPFSEDTPTLEPSPPIAPEPYVIPAARDLRESPLRELPVPIPGPDQAPTKAPHRYPLPFPLALENESLAVRKFMNDSYDFMNHTARVQAANDLILTSLAQLLSPNGDVSQALGNLAGALETSNNRTLGLQTMVDQLNVKVEALATRQVQ